MSKPFDKVAMENVNSPGRVVRVDADKYNTMKRAILAVLPKLSPGLTVAELKTRLLPLLPEDLFPGGAKAGWWLKGVQLDLEAKGLITRVTASCASFTARPRTVAAISTNASATSMARSKGPSMHYSPARLAAPCKIA